MIKYSIETKKSRLEKAIKKSLKIANSEMMILGQYYAEENLRYVVMSEISNVKCFGVFPNNSNSKNYLCFEKKYQYIGFSDSDNRKFKPDIVSLDSDRIDSEEEPIHNLVIELKSKSVVKTIKDPKKRQVIKKEVLKEQIKLMDSCIERDILKTRIYLEKKYDDHIFEFGVVLSIGLPSEKKNELANQLQEILREQQSELKKISENKTYKNLLFGWYNPILNEPEIFWLNQKDKINISMQPKERTNFETLINFLETRINRNLNILKSRLS